MNCVNLWKENIINHVHCNELSKSDESITFKITPREARRVRRPQFKKHWKQYRFYLVIGGTLDILC